MWVAVAVSVAVAGAAQRPVRDQSLVRSYWLEELVWTDAEQVLGPETVVVIPLGAAALEHGRHLTLRAEAALAQHLARQVAAATPVVVAPMLTYHHYPGFDEYPGSSSLSLDSARTLTVDVARSLARHGPRRFYVLTTANWSDAALEASAETLARDGILLRYTNASAHLEPVAKKVQQQEGGGHADEIETSMMLHVDEALVDMSKAEKSTAPASRPFQLTRRPSQAGTYSPTGAWGDPTRATAEKGRVLLDALFEGVLGDIASLRAAVPVAAAARTRDATAPPTRPSGPPLAPDRCSAGDQRQIRGIGSAFTAFWANKDAELLAALWTEGGDIAHPDGSVERTSRNILINRTELFRRHAYRLSRHPIQIGVIRCLTSDIAIADGKWELRDVTDGNGKILPTVNGLLTLVLRRADGEWRIEAYRYTIDAPAEPLPPTLLKRPGFPGEPYSSEF
jgi:creatinine amidohydrolase